MQQQDKKRDWQQGRDECSAGVAQEIKDGWIDFAILLAAFAFFGAMDLVLLFLIIKNS